MEFGEAVHFIPFRADARADKFDAKSREGVCSVGVSSTHSLATSQVSTALHVRVAGFLKQ